MQLLSFCAAVISKSEMHETTAKKLCQYSTYVHHLRKKFLTQTAFYGKCDKQTIEMAIFGYTTAKINLKTIDFWTIGNTNSYYS